MRLVLCLSKRTPTSKQDRAERLPSVLVLESILMCEALPPTLAKEHTQFTMRWYSACKHGSKKHRNTWRNAAHFLFGILQWAQEWVLCLNFDNKYVFIVCYFGGNFGGFGCPDPHLDPKRAQGPINTRFHRFQDEEVVPLGGLLGNLFGTFYFWSLRDTKKVGLGGPSKQVPFLFVDFGVCLEGLRRVPVSTVAQFSLLQPGPKRVPKWEPKWSLLGSQIRTILTLGHHLAEIGAQKAASKNECRIWGGKRCR